MRTVIIGLITLGLSSAAFGENKAVLDLDEDTWKAFSQLEVKLSEIKGDDAALFGGAIGWELDNEWSISWAGYGMFTEVEPERNETEIIDDLRFWYTGLRGEYTYHGQTAGNLSAHFLVGAGQVEETLLTPGSADNESTFIILEPSIGVGIDVYDFVEIGARLGYWWVLDVDLPVLDEDDLSEFNGTIYIRFQTP